MISRHALVGVLAAAALRNTIAFAPCRSNTCAQRTTPLFSTPATSKEEDLEQTRKVIMDHIEIPSEESSEPEPEVATPIMDIPPTPVEAAKPKPAAKKAPKKKMGGAHKEGVFSPIVVAAGAVMGPDQLNKVRAKVISIHSDLIKSFVGTSDSDFGQVVLKQLFNLVDTDNSGYLDKEEVGVALEMLGFKWLKDKQVAKIFQRADANGDFEISLEEFMEEAPKTLKVNLVKLAKNNGGDMGLLV